ncbi:MAG: HD domain-containing protein [Polyangiaceae bacterium]|nr:HD domain-containing protein [Polyangiaceae bacterium]
MRTTALRAAAAVARRLVRASLRDVVMVLVLVAAALLVTCGFMRHPAPETLSKEETAQVYAALLSHAQPGGPNHLHSRRLYHYAPPFAEAAGANVHIVQAAALLHDATKEDGKGEPKEKFCTHGDQGSNLTREVLAKLGKSESFVELASGAVREHMGPCGFNLRFFSRRFMSKFCGRSYPKPSSLEAQVLYDIDMLDLMTVDGVVKVAELRQKNPEFEKEPLRDSVVAGADSAWKSVIDAKQTLITSRAQACGADLATHTERFIDGLDWTVVVDVPALKQAATAYLTAKPLPECLPAVPPWDRGRLP